MINRKTSTYRKGDIIDVVECPDGRYGAPGMPRIKKKKPTPEQMQKVNHWNKVRRCRAYLLEYFHSGDPFTVWSYQPKQRPPDMDGALKDFKKAIGYVRKEYRKRGYELFWIRNIEKGTKGAWHIHIVVNEIEDTGSILKKAWSKGGTYSIAIRDDDKFYDEDFTKLAGYLTKDENTREKKKDGTYAKPKIKESSYSHSRNMQLTRPEKDKLHRWKKEVKPKKGYYIVADTFWEGINPATGYKCRRYTMIRLNRSVKDDESNHIHRDHACRARNKGRQIRGSCRVHHKKRKAGGKKGLRGRGRDNVVQKRTGGSSQGAEAFKPSL